MNQYNNREEIPIKYKWNLTDFYINDNEWKNNYNQVINNLSKLENYKNKVHNSELLLEYLNKYMDMRCKILNLYVYAYLKHDVELYNQKYSDMLEKANNMYTKFNIAISFFESELLQLDKLEFQKLFNNDQLKKYYIYLNDIYKQKNHILSEEQEKLISKLTDTYKSYENIASQLINNEHDYGTITTSDGENVKIAINNIRRLKQDDDSNIRKRATLKFSKTLKQYQNTEAMLLNYFIKNNINLSKIRNYNSAWDKYLEQNKLTNKIFKSLKNVCEKNLIINQKYFKLMKKVLNLKTIKFYDTSLIWSKNKKEYTIEESIKIVTSSLNILGDEYNNKLIKIFDNNYIDYCSYKGKCGGGYSYSTYDKNSRILMNFNKTFKDISTIAHESGHNVHHQFINENNYSWYRKQPTIISEVASLTNEFLLANYMIKNGETKNEKLVGLENIIKVYQSNFFGAIMEGTLELMMYKQIEIGKNITSDFLNEKTSELLEKYQGRTTVKSKYSNLIWVTRSHYYMPFYLFSYAISVSVAAVLADKIINKEDGILEKYYKFLKAGSNINPMDVYKILDIDIEQEETYLKGINYFNKQLELYKKIINE